MKYRIIENKAFSEITNRMLYQLSKKLKPNRKYRIKDA